MGNLYWFDPVAYEVILDEEVEELLREFYTINDKRDLAHAAYDVGLVRVYKHNAQGHLLLARECKHCGAPVGCADPDYAQFILSCSCYECRGMELY